MATAKITSKGQITLPRAVRDALRVGPGDRLLFYVRSDGRVEVVAQTIDVMSLVGSVKTDVRGVTIEAMDEGIGRGVAEEFERSVR